MVDMYGRRISASDYTNNQLVVKCEFVLLFTIIFNSKFQQTKCRVCMTLLKCVYRGKGKGSLFTSCVVWGTIVRVDMNIKPAPLLYFVMPCYNEEQGICETIETVKLKLEKLEDEGLVAKGSSMLFADDGSADATWRLISAAHAVCPERVKAV